MKRLVSGFLLIVLVFAVMTAQPLADWYQQRALFATLTNQDHAGESAGESRFSEPVPADSPAASIFVPASKTISLPQPSPQPSPIPRSVKMKSDTVASPATEDTFLSGQETLDLLSVTETSIAIKMAKAEGSTIIITQATTAKPAPKPRPTTASETAAIEETRSSLPDASASPRKINPNKPMICLTYDDGPTNGVTSVILDVLKANNASATFFVIGQSVSGNKALLRRMVTEGHEIGNHTYNHKSMIRISREEGLRQINMTQQAIKDAVGIIPRIFRPPYNELNSSVLAYMPLPVIRWSVDEKDWSNKTASQIASANLSKAKDGSIILLHDVRYASAEASKTIIPELVRRGYQLVTVSEMFEARGITLKPAGVYRYAYP